MGIRKKVAPIVTLEMLSGGSNSISLIFITLIKRYLGFERYGKTQSPYVNNYLDESSIMIIC